MTKSELIATIITDRPNEMWGTDGIRIETVDEGWVWVLHFSDRANEHLISVGVVVLQNLRPRTVGLEAGAQAEAYFVV